MCTCSFPMKVNSICFFAPFSQALVRANGMRYFSSKLLQDVSSLVEREVQRSMKHGTSRSNAAISTNQDIIAGNMNPGFYEKLKRVMQIVFPVLNFAVMVGKAVRPALGDCSLM